MEEINRFVVLARYAGATYMPPMSNEFRTMVLCCLPSIAAVKIDRQPNVAVEYDRLELLEFLRANFVPMNAMCERGGMFERLTFDRTNAIFEYFKVPFDAAPP